VRYVVLRLIRTPGQSRSATLETSPPRGIHVPITNGTGVEQRDEGFTGQTAAAVSGEVPPVERCQEWDEETIENTTENAEERQNS